MNDVALDQLTGWLERFGVSGLHGYTVDDLFKSAAMTAVGEAGPVLGTFFLRFGMTAGAVTALSPAALGAAMRGGLEGVVARGESEAAADLALAIEAYTVAVEGGADAAAAASAAASVVEAHLNGMAHPLFASLAAELA